MANRKIQVEIVGDASSLERAFGRASKSSSGFGRGLASASKVAAGAFVALGLGAKIGFSELAEGQRASAQTEAVLKSTAGAAKVTQSSIEALAGALSQKTGVDDEVIQSGQNMLLTFTKIRNEVGQGKDVFDQATRATLDLSVAMGKDMQSSAILVGKALNDPIRGMSALSRAGIQFTAEQKEMIKTLVESGDTMGAQKLILKELETQFGGSANAAGKTLTGSLNKARNAFEEMTAQLVSALLPTLTRFAGFVQTASKFMTEHQRAVQISIVALASLATAVLLVNAGVKVYTASMAIATAATWAFNAALRANPIVLVISLIAALAAALVVAYKTSETFRNIVNGVFNTVRNTIATVITSILGAVDKFLGGLQAILSAASKLPFVGDKFKGLADQVGSAREKVRALGDAIEGLKSKDISITTTFYERTEKLPGNPIGRRAHGGPVGAGSPYIVGERGPELFVPRMSGSIVPNGSGAMAAIGSRGGGGTTINVNVNAGTVVGTNGMDELAETIRERLNRMAGRNVGLRFG